MSEFLPNPSGFLEWFFLLVLIGLTGAVGSFALFLLVNVFRNPGRKPRT
jgi:hypothetical protein